MLRKEHPVALLVGHSHIHAVNRAFLASPESYQIRLVIFGLGRFGRMVVRNNGEVALDGALVDELRAISELHRPAVCFSSVGGNAHNVMGLLEHPRPFDFVLHERPELPLRPAAEVVPSRLMRRALESKVQGQLDGMRLIHAELGIPAFHLESPPTVESEEHVRKSSEKAFVDRLRETAVAPAALRYKLARLHSAIFSDACADFGVSFVAVPEEASDEHGFLVPEAWSDNATHGSERYGAMVLRQIESLTLHALASEQSCVGRP